MKILNITAQKPSSTGSGVFLSELVRVFAEQGHAQMVIAGVDPEDQPVFPEGVRFLPVLFHSEELPFAIVGMSDEMPYTSTRYCDMTPGMTGQFEAAFSNAVRRAMAEFQPDVVLCHHLYLLTAIVREIVTEIPVYGFCHNTDLRQMRKHGLERDRIAAAIRKLDRIFVLRSDQIREVQEVYGADPEKMTPIGMGYNRHVFFPTDRSQESMTRLIYAGKITQKKGVRSLIQALSLINEPAGTLELVCAGGAGNEEEYREIVDLAKRCPYPITFTGRLDQKTLALWYNRSDIFVLPSFYEGIPLTVIEALACGCRVVISDLPGVREWLDEFVTGADIRYVPLPTIRNTDEAVEEELPAFEQRLADALRESIHSPTTGPCDVSRISWERIGNLVLYKQ